MTNHLKVLFECHPYYSGWLLSPSRAMHDMSPSESVGTVKTHLSKSYLHAVSSLLVV